MNSNDFLERASDIAFSKLNEVGGKLHLVDEPLRTIVIVCSAQGRIDNGGLEYFFESNFPDNPSYEIFIHAYREIGAIEEAGVISKSLTFFAMPKPELDEAGRRKFMSTLPSDFSHDFSRLSDQLCGNEHIWSLLENYAERNKARIFNKGDRHDSAT